MFVVGLTGGIGSGKSAVAELLSERGLTVIDADRIAREIVEPGSPALAELVRHFGEDIVGADGALDRPLLASRAFDDEISHAALEEITHPHIARAIDARLEELAASPTPPDMVVVDHPLLVETGQVDRFDALIVVVADEQARFERLVDVRGMDPDDVRARMARQADDQMRRAVATHVIDNSAGLEELAEEVDRVHRDLLARSGAA